MGRAAAPSCCQLENEEPCTLWNPELFSSPTLGFFPGLDNTMVSLATGTIWTGRDLVVVPWIITTEYSVSVHRYFLVIFIYPTNSKIAGIILEAKMKYGTIVVFIQSLKFCCLFFCTKGLRSFCVFKGTKELSVDLNLLWWFCHLTSYNSRSEKGTFQHANLLLHARLMGGFL